MTSGGARNRSGPPADPNALRRDRADDKGWTTLPAEGFQGDIPEWPLATGGEHFSSILDYWEFLWRKPQAFMWDKLGMKHQIAAYALAFIESTDGDSSAGLKTAVLRMEGELGVSIVGMNGLRWKFSEDDLAARRAPSLERPASSVKSRLKGA